ncbi:Variant surface glycoprotein [Trypanosoma congolense IL3000]|uniref:Variant surface glycoprotein n=1 Tax=Trypanosoma congolense (strain IL3000) TaxID=1068625 RepID=F9W4V8_TRYCI|nr:Variant surface glycoprotein [Trypanosoma congolense IL3000]
MMMKFWTVLYLCVVGVIADTNVKNYNLEEYNALCNLLKIAVYKWSDLKSKGSGDPLKKALGRTLFGERDGDEVQSLKAPFPKDYEKVIGNHGTRYFWCGQRRKENELSGVNLPRSSGHSAPHDLVCLCTVGKDGWPVNDGEGKLCGQSKEIFKGGTKGWGTGAPGEVKEQIAETWNKVVTPCLQKSEVGESLRGALKIFKDRINKTISNEGKSGYLLGKGDPKNYPCSGNGQVCVMYYDSTDATEHPPWWVDLEEAINKDEAEQELKKREDEKRKKEEAKNQHHTHKKENSLPQHAPRTAALQSPPQDIQEAEQTNHDNISAPLETLEEASGTHITPPCSWFLGVLLLI